MDQSVLSGHVRRPGDLDLFAGLGIRALRYPVLWEKVSPERPDHRDFAYADERLNRIRDLGMRPIVGLCHHGSGPAYTSLVDDNFADGLAQHARATAERYSWVTDWTPVNEPLTTARFSALYGIWYPHTSNEGAFWRALLNQIDATRLSMREIRRIRPDARLVQTEDLGFCHATPAMRAQAEFENARRWITWDLLCGMVTPDHPLWERISAWGFESRLRAIADDPCPPDVLGLNHYLSSERLLDHRTELYPPHLLGGDGPGPYVNIEAVRTVRPDTLGIGELLRQTWERYGRTIAITECHNGCTREEQMRWFVEVWRAAEAARSAGVDVQAVAAWALLGSIDWNRLLATEAGHYECGVFDVSSGEPEPTAMADLLRELAAGREPSHPALPGLGWWRRDDRFYSQALQIDVRTAAPRAPLSETSRRPILVAGPAGARMQALRDACALRDLDVRVVEVGACAEDAADRVQAAAAAAGAWAVIHLTAGSAPTSKPNDVVQAIWTCGRERAELQADGLHVLSGELMSRAELRTFTEQVIDALSAGRTFRAAADRRAPGACVYEAAHKVLDLLIDGVTGRVRLVADEGPSWAELATIVAREIGLDAFLVEPVTVSEIRPRAVLDHPETTAERTRRLPPLAAAVAHLVSAHKLVSAGRNSCPASEADDVSGLQQAAE
ncbi:family 1 glycosylhydrolase [Phenylobacterium sp.]|uniref:family 1 glycosylhydrolase n=1 Tax=Phenylobacterium sp. TaxID=1871053 RepID=UPI0028127B3D|nr:family 1 glycosylhydrolase [Phenylobacterium sp.]